jgi:hypothetical protein
LEIDAFRDAGVLVEIHVRFVEVRSAEAVRLLISPEPNAGSAKLLFGIAPLATSVVRGLTVTARVRKVVDCFHRR